MNNLQDGTDILETDKNAHDLFEQHQTLQTEMQKYHNRKTLGAQVMKKEMDEENARLGDPKDREFACQSPMTLTQSNMDTR